jgi:hypothetical protein
MMIPFLYEQNLGSIISNQITEYPTNGPIKTITCPKGGYSKIISNEWRKKSTCGYVIFLSSFVRDVVVCCGHQFDMAFAMTSADMVFAIALLYMVFAMILCWTWVLQ